MTIHPALWTSLVALHTNGPRGDVLSAELKKASQDTQPGGI